MKGEYVSHKAWRTAGLAMASLLLCFVPTQTIKTETTMLSGVCWKTMWKIKGIYQWELRKRLLEAGCRRKMVHDRRMIYQIVSNGYEIGRKQPTSRCEPSVAVCAAQL